MSGAADSPLLCFGGARPGDAQALLKEPYGVWDVPGSARAQQALPCYPPLKRLSVDRSEDMEHDW